MEPLAHTLTGACLAEAGLKRLTPLATTTLLIAANLPDVDGTCYLVGSDLAFGFRRGWTHGILAWFALPVALTYAMLAFDRFVRRRRRPDLPPARQGPLLALATLGVATHPFLDWLNNYGIRLLMPISDRWFYGDTLFIVDPWLWVVLGGGAALGWTRSKGGTAAAALMAAGMTTLMWANPVVPAWARGTWMAALAGWVTLRWWLPARRVGVAARVALLAAALYIAVNFAGARAAEARARALARERGWDTTRLAAMPQPLDPSRRVVIAVTPQQYWFLPLGWGQPGAGASAAESVPRGTFDGVVEAALNAPAVQGTRRWLRFPSYEVQARPDGTYRVLIRDARFAIGSQPGFGVVAVIDLDRNLQPME